MEVGTKEDTYYILYLISYIYLSIYLIIPPSDLTVQLSLAKWNWPIIVHIYVKNYDKYFAVILQFKPFLSKSQVYLLEALSTLKGSW